jgi:hypothetical protein
LVVFGKKQPGDILSYYTPSISWNSCGRFFSRKHSILVDFSAPLTNVAEFGNAVPKEYSLSQNYPNPFNPTTQIRYSIPRTGYVSLKVYDLLGQEVATLHAGVQQAGSYVATFDGTGLASGVYFFRMQASNFVETKKLILLK